MSIVEEFRSMSKLIETLKSPEILAISDSDNISEPDLDSCTFTEQSAFDIILNSVNQDHINQTTVINNEYDEKILKLVKDHTEYKTRINSKHKFFSQLQLIIPANHDTTYDQLHIDVIRASDSYKELLATCDEKHDKKISMTIDEKKSKLIAAQKQYAVQKQAIYSDVVVDEVLDNILAPSREMELGMAVAVLIHMNPSFCPTDDDRRKPSSDLIRSMIKTLHNETKDLSQKIFEEYLITRAKEILFKRLTDEYLPFGENNYDYAFIPKDGIDFKLTDTFASQFLIVEQTDHS